MTSPIAADWPIVRLCDIADLQRGKFTARPRTDPRFFGGPYPFIQTGDVPKSGGVISSYSQTLNDQGLSVSKLFPADTLFFTIAANIADVGIARFATACPDSLVAISPRPTVDKRWLLYALGFRKKHFESIATQNAQLNINLEKLRPYELRVPILAEQQAIAQALTDVDDLIRSLERLIAKKRDLKQAAMQQLLTGQTRLPGFSGEWPKCTLGSIGTFTKGQGIRKDQVREYGLPCIRYGEIYTRHSDYIRRFYSFIDSGTAAESYRLKNGDLLFAGSGETAEEIGKCVAFVGSEEAYAGGDIVVLSPHGQESRFLGYLMNHPYVARQKARMGQGDAVCHIGARHLSAVTLRLPEHKEQTAIAEVLSDMDAEITALEARLAKTRDIKQGMMQELLTGRTRLV